MNEILIFILTIFTIYLLLKTRHIIFAMDILGKQAELLINFTKGLHARNMVKSALTDYFLGLVKYEVVYDIINDSREIIEEEEYQNSMKFLNEIRDFKRDNKKENHRAKN